MKSVICQFYFVEEKNKSNFKKMYNVIAEPARKCRDMKKNKCRKFIFVFNILYVCK